jgi:hypothetical protein
MIGNLMLALRGDPSAAARQPVFCGRDFGMTQWRRCTENHCRQRSDNQITELIYLSLDIIMLVIARLNR